MITVTKPFLPPLEELTPYLERIWESKILSNNGDFHQELENALAAFLGVEHLSLFCNATVALMTAQRLLGVEGEVITTPYSFVATSHALDWMGNTPVFADIEPLGLTIDPESVERLITPKTSAIMPLHCYGNLCRTEELREIAAQNGLKIIYDACHSFGVEDDGGSSLRHGDISVVSFHATKVFNTFEGGLLVCGSAEMKAAADRMKNFGFQDEVTVLNSGINGKMSEFNAAIGLLQLKHLSAQIQCRALIDDCYRQALEPALGITCVDPVGQTKRNYAYFPILVGPDYPLSRDQLYERLASAGFQCRRYFYPLIPEFPVYSGLPSADVGHLPVALETSRRVICLPLYSDLSISDAKLICDVITSVF